MTDSPDEYGELLRRVLSAEADSVVPSPDGLEIIRGRIERRGLRRLAWWRAGASLAGAALVAGAVVLVVPGLREQVAEVTQAGDVKPATTAPTDLSGTSRPLPTRDQVPSAGTRPTTQPSVPAQTRQAAPNPPPQPSSKPTPTPTPTPTCPTADPEATPEPEEPREECEEIETPTPTPAEPSLPAESPCPGAGCQEAENPQTPQPPLPSEEPAPTPIG
ncbi:hypothetical protein ACFOWE_14200 [Planomonospora corallina]|uniref:Uncharacterized protein n=1 Tax=Planomonospora corallina TaxID=1806052 RepID=A0ABV8I8V4_9ACTN